MKKFNQNTAIVLSRLRELNYTDRNIRMHELFYAKISKYLIQIGKTYAPPLGITYVQTLQESRCKQLYFEKSAVAKLNDVFETGDIKGIHLSITYLGRTVSLPTDSLIQIDIYLNEVSSAYSDSQIYNIKRRVIRFMKCMCQRGKLELSSLHYDDIIAFHESLSYMKKVSRTVEESSVIAFLEYMETKELIHYGLSLYLAALEVGNQSIFNVLSKSCVVQSNTFGNNKHTISSSELHSAIIEIIKNSPKEGYSEGYIKILLHVSKQLYLFFDINDFSFNSDIARDWVKSEAVQTNICDSSRYSMMRMIDLLEIYFSCNSIDFTVSHKRGLSGYEALPEWCKLSLDMFANERRKEKLDGDTVDNYVYSCTRFCDYLVRNGIEYFNEINADIITAFNLYDKHGSSEGKNSCNYRIRKFLKFLFRENIVSQPMLYAALGTSGAAHEKNVIVLDEKEIDSIRDYVKKAVTPLEKRNSAMLLLGAEMGMRGCDIVALKLEDIDWKNQTIRFVQDKTDVETVMPMPASVGNSIYHYIRNARPTQTEDNHIFLRLNAPYCGMTRNACYSALKKAIPYRNVKGSGFHVTRKTFATSKLKAGVIPNQIMDIMGQRNIKSLTPYLSLDSDRMKMCPLSLRSLGLFQEGGDKVW